MNGRITAYIHMDAIAQNFQSMKEKLDENTQMIAVVKTDGYGHGAVPIARMAEAYDYVWGFATATFEEAVQLREAGIQKPVLILGYTFREDYAGMVQLGIRPSVYTSKMAEQFAEEAKRQGVCAPVHIAVDTGMSRIGILPDGAGEALVQKVCAMPELKLEGIFTHFARADEKDKSDAYRQMDRFSDFCSLLERKGVKDFLRHCSNSAGILEMRRANMDIVRAGITIYGIYPSDEMERGSLKIRPAMELKSHIVHLKTIEPGTPVSYGGTFVASRPTRIATIPVGYGDGYPRSLSNCGYVLIRGKKAPIVGRICMDQFMADVSGIEAEMLDEVTLLGRDCGAEITIDELGALSGRFPYEFVCDIGKRVPRVYV